LRDSRPVICVNLVECRKAQKKHGLKKTVHIASGKGKKKSLGIKFP
jgi:hypothetical protein